MLKRQLAAVSFGLVLALLPACVSTSTEVLTWRATRDFVQPEARLQIRGAVFTETMVSGVHLVHRSPQGINPRVLMLEVVEVPAASATGGDPSSRGMLVPVDHVEPSSSYDRVVIWHKGKWIADVPVADGNGSADWPAVASGPGRFWPCPAEPVTRGSGTAVRTDHRDGVRTMRP